MFNYTLQETNILAVKHHFNRDTLEKVLRLVDLLSIIQKHPDLKDYYVLKGGTAINLCLTDFPRLSVDIDLDFNRVCSKEQMQEIRDTHRRLIIAIVELEGYILDGNQRNSFALDGYVLKYVNLKNNLDNIKLDINYLNRVHIFHPVSYDIKSTVIEMSRVIALNKVELYGSKIAALISRTAARDVFDVFMMIQLKIMDSTELILLRKSALFYLLNSCEVYDIQSLLNEFFNRMEEFSFWNVKRNLLPLLKVGETLNLKEMKELVISFIHNLFLLNQSELDYADSLSRQLYNPSLLFDDLQIIQRLSNHPTALWKIARVKSL